MTVCTLKYCLAVQLVCVQPEYDLPFFPHRECPWEEVKYLTEVILLYSSISLLCFLILLTV